MTPSRLPSHDDFTRFAAAMPQLLRAASGFSGVVYRATSPRHASLPDLISGVGSLIHGSRWNSPGTMRVLHAAATPEAAVAEALALRRRFGLPDQSSLPLVIRGIGCDLHSVLDLNAAGARRVLRVSLTRLRNCDWQAENRAGREAVTQAIGRAAAEAGFDGLLCPSAAVSGAVNVVVFAAAIDRPAAVRLSEG